MHVKFILISSLRKYYKLRTVTFELVKEHAITALKRFDKLNVNKIQEEQIYDAGCKQKAPSRFNLKRLKIFSGISAYLSINFRIFCITLNKFSTWSNFITH